MSKLLKIPNQARIVTLGGIECDISVSRIGANEFYLVTDSGCATPDFDSNKRNLPTTADARIDDMTSA